MAISPNSVFGFSSKLQAKYQHVSGSSAGASVSKATKFSCSLGFFSSRIIIKGRRKGSCLSGAEGNHLYTETSSKDSGESFATNSSSADSIGENSQLHTSASDESGPQFSGASNASNVSSDVNQKTSPNLQSTPKRSPLTARERLKAARALNRYAESKASKKSEMGSNVLDAIRESDRGKRRSGLPEAPTNLFDDSKRGLPKQGWTFQFPGGSDLFFIVLSFVLISTVMFTTTYIVWKAGAIHFNEN